MRKWSQMNNCTTVQPDCRNCSSAFNGTGRCLNYRQNSAKFWVLDAIFGTLLGFLVVWSHEYLIPDSWPLPWFFLASMSIVMVLQSLMSFFIGNLIGEMEAMIPGGFIGMGAMIVAVRQCYLRSGLPSGAGEIGRASCRERV